MPRPCSICPRSDRAVIDTALLAITREPLRRLAVRYETSAATLHRHARRCIPEAVSKAAAHKREDAVVQTGAGILRQLEELQTQTLRVLTDSGEDRVRLAAVGQARANLALMAELLGELTRGPSAAVGISLHTSPEWIGLRGELLRALEPFPEARAAVATRLSPVERADAYRC
jgi:hypothetical protein